MPVSGLGPPVSPTEPLVLAEVAGGVGRVTLNRPGKRNALNATVVAELSRRLARLGDDPSARVIALRGYT